MMGVSSDDPDLMCPDCHRLLTRMDRYETVIDLHGVETSGGGYAPINGGTMGFLAFGWLINAMFTWRHRAKSRKLCATILPDYPNTLICSFCLFVYKRR